MANVRAFASSPCGGVVIGKVLQVNMAGIKTWLGSNPVHDMNPFGVGQG